MLTSNVKILMEKQRISIHQLAEKAKVSHNTVVRARKSSTIEKCSLGTLAKIADALHHSPKQLFEYERQR